MYSSQIYVTSEVNAFGLTEGQRYAARPSMHAGEEHLFVVLVSDRFECYIAKHHFVGFSHTANPNRIHASHGNYF